jgi:hypothetical protein
MGDRTYTSIRFGGKITATQADELIQELEGQGCRCDDPDTGKLETSQLTASSFYDSECNYGQMEGVEDYCREHGIAYEKCWEAGGDYGPGIMIFTGTEEHESGTLDGEVVVTRSQFLKLGTGILEFFDRFDFSKHPPLVIVEDGSEQEAA